VARCTSETPRLARIGRASGPRPGGRSGLGLWDSPSATIPTPTP